MATKKKNTYISRKKQGTKHEASLSSLLKSTTSAVFSSTGKLGIRLGG